MKRKIIVMTALLVTGLVVMYAQDRSHIKNDISRWGRCLNVALTQTRGNVAMDGTRASWANIPNELHTELQGQVNRGSRIWDVHITESGAWVMVTSTTVISSRGVPTEFQNTHMRMSREGNNVLAASFNCHGQWIIIGERTWSSSNAEFAWIQSGANQHGNPVSACFTNEGLVVVFQRGIIGAGTYPAGMWAAARDYGGGVAKFAGNSWFVADRNGSFSFSM